MPAVFARQSVSVTTYFAEGFFRRISIRNDTVVVESTSATAAEKGSRENRGVPRNAAAAANHIFTVFPIEALNISVIQSSGDSHAAGAILCLQLSSVRYNASLSERRDMKMNLKSMTIDALVGLKGRIEAVLASKVSDERRALETELAKLTRFESGGARSKSIGRGVRGKVAPKYRNPEDPTETWAGRGLKPRWLAAAIKSGKKLDDFAISGTVKEAKKPRKKRVAKK
jgi:DNA-binding protein H-NS